jgi:hypothetical protein
MNHAANREMERSICNALDLALQFGDESVKKICKLTIRMHFTWLS